MTEGTDTLDVIAPQGKTIMYLGEPLEVLPMEIGQLPKVVRAARPIIAALVAMEGSVEDGELLIAFDLVVEMMEEHGEQLYIAAAAAIGRDEAWVAKGRLAEFLTLATTIIEVNRDFFVQTLAPMLAARAREHQAKRAAKQAAKATSGDGQTPSNSSSSVATS